MQYTIIAILALALYSCSVDTTKAENVIKDDVAMNLKGKSLKVKGNEGVDLRFSFSESYRSEEGTVYQVSSHYEDKNIGFYVIVHNEGDLKITLKSTGEDSDNFLQVLQTLYAQYPDSSLKFTEAITGDCLPMGDYVERMNKKSGKTSKVVEKKLFFEGRKKDEYAEMYLAINEHDRWIEFKEADQAFRPAFIKLLTKKGKRENRNTKKAGTRELAPGKV